MNTIARTNKQLTLGGADMKKTGINHLQRLAKTFALPLSLLFYPIGAQALCLDPASEAPLASSKLTASTLTSVVGHPFLQRSLWAIDVLTGTKVWSQNVGRMQTLPWVRGDRIIVGTLAGEIKALNKSDGTEIWSVNTGGFAITTTIFPEFRNAHNGAYKGWIVAVDFLGRINVVRDEGATGKLLWTTSLPNGVRATGNPAPSPSDRKIYVDADDGQVYQLDFDTGVVEANRLVDSAPGAIVGSSNFVFEDTDGNGSFDDVRMITGSSNGQLHKYCKPWAIENL